MKQIFNKLLLLALPASGKSEIRTFLSSIPKEKLISDFHLGETVQLDDFPYVHMMRRIDEELDKAGEKRVFFNSPEKPFLEPESWGVLIELLNEDYEDLVNKRKPSPESAAQYLLKRIDRARQKAGSSPLFYRGGEGDSSLLLPEIMSKLLSGLEAESADLLRKKQQNIPESLEGKTLIFEFARGGAQGAEMPLAYGYQYSLAKLSPEILSDACLLYVWVTPEESRRRNFERADPNDPGSILKHGVPIEVMLKDYGCDDLDYLLESSDHPGFIKVESSGGYLPTAKFDNRVDKTSFVRNPVWKEEEKEQLYNGLKDACQRLFAGYLSLSEIKPQV